MFQNVKNSFTDNDYIEFVFSHFDLNGCNDLYLDILRGDIFSVNKENKNIRITVNEKVQLFFALTIILANIELPSFEYVKNTTIKTIGFMLDCSRSAVLNIESCKQLIVMLAKLGYNTLELYTEDTYEIPSEPYFGHLRGRYTQKELKEINDFAQLYGIELIPCIQTLAHLDNLFLWPEYWDLHDITDCILIDDDRTYALIDKMFESLSHCFTSKTIHIGYDEAYYAGRGRYLDKHGYVKKNKLLLKHLDKVLSIADKYGFSCKIYADFFLNNGDFENEDSLPSNVKFVYWNYYSTKKSSYIKDLRKMQRIIPNLEFRAGDWKWLGNTPMNRYGMKRTKAGITAAEEFGLDSVSLSAWGDNGNECSVFATIPQILFFSAMSYFKQATNSFLNNIALTLTNLSFREFLSLDLANTYKIKNPKLPVNPAKYLLLNDPLCGIMDAHVNSDYNEYYRKSSRTLRTIAKRAGEWQYLFDEQMALCEYLAVKANMGNDLYKLYKEKDLVGLKVYVLKNVNLAIKKLDKFIIAYRKAWRKENKSFGFDVSELRLGGQKQRLCEIQLCVNEYLSGKIDKIEELEQPKLLFDKNNEEGLLYVHNAKYITSPFFQLK